MAKVCRRTGKLNLRSEQEARRALTRIASRESLRRQYLKVEVAYYKCLYCPYWHLTSQKQHGRQ